MNKIKLLLLLIVAVGFLVGCDDYDSWTTDTDARLTFSQDTVAFDTVIAGQSSTTRTLMVRNENDKGLRISRVQLREGASSLFRVNVDGQYLSGGEGEEYEVRRKDSIYVRLEVCLPETGGTDILHYEDELRFTLENGQMQRVVLTADGMDVDIIRGLHVSADTLLQSARPILLYDSLRVDSGATLTLAPGTTLMMHDHVEILLHGTLKAIGTPDQPITLRGDRVDRMFPYLPYDNTPNRWGGIHIYGTSLDNELAYCDIHSGDYGIVCDSTTVGLSAQRPALTMTNCVVHNVGGVGLQLQDCVTRIVGTQISNTLGHCVDILGGDHLFVHTTIAQYYPFDASRGDALFMGNTIGMNGDLYHHLERAHFLNCVITGYAEDVIMGSIVEGSDYQCNYLFDHCFLRTVESDDTERFVEVVYDNDDLELEGEDNFTLFDTHNFLYDFTPDSLSVIRSLADIEHTRRYSQTDLKGRSRLQDGQPDAGAYEYQ